MEGAINQPDDERLRELLAIEQQLQDLVRVAKEDATRLITKARTASKQRLEAAREAAERADADDARAGRVIHNETLAAIDASSEAALAEIARLSDRRVDELARWALVQAIGRPGGPA